MYIFIRYHSFEKERVNQIDVDFNFKDTNYVYSSSTG